MQELFIILLFLGALGYLGNMLYKQTKGDSACSSGCGSCGSPVVDKFKEARNDGLDKTTTQNSEGII